MMVLRHVGPPSTTVKSRDHEDIPGDEDRTTIPIDLSNKHAHSHSPSPSPELPRHLSRNPFLSIIPSPRPISSPRTPPSHASYILNNNNNNNVANNNINFLQGSKCSSPQSSNSDENSPRGKGEIWRLRKKDLRDLRWRDVSVTRNDDELNSHSSPDSGLHRDSPGEDEDVASSKATTPPLPLSLNAIRKQPQTLIPLSIIRARYPQSLRGDGLLQEEDPDASCSPKTGRGAGGGDQVKVQTKRARLEEMVTHIKSSKDRSRRNSGEDDTSSGGHVTSSDEVNEDVPADLRSSVLHEDDIMEDDHDEPCNLVCPQNRMRGRTEDLHNLQSQFDGWKNGGGKDYKEYKDYKESKGVDSMSPNEAAKMLGVDPDTYQQQMMQLQLTSAAMMGDPSALLKGMGPYPPWVLMGYYSQLIQSFQAQELLRQYAIQANPLTPNISQGDKSPNIPRNLGSSRYNCQSPMSPASLSEGPAGMDSDGSTVGHSTPGSGNNGKRAPRAMTGRHVRTGTGASPSTLQTLRQKIEERQRIKAQQARNDLLNQPNSKIKSNKYLKKSNNKK